MHHFAGAWHACSAASAKSIEALERELGDRLPNEYLKFLAWSNGGEGPLLVQPYTLCLDSAEEVLRQWQEGQYREYFPSFLVIGSNGAGEYVAFDLRHSLMRAVVALDMTNIDLSESVLPIAQDFASLLELIAEPEADA